MTKDHDFKELVRARSARTGESYVEARRQLVAALERAAGDDTGDAVTTEVATAADLAPTAMLEPPAKQRRLLVLIADGHVELERVHGRAPESGSQLQRLGIMLEGSHPLSLIDFDDESVQVQGEGHIRGELCEDFDLEIHANGHVSVDGVRGDVTVTTTDGHVDVDGELLNVSVTTGDGHVSIRGGLGLCEVNTGDGDITLAGHFVDVYAQTGDGHITVDATDGGTIATGDGNVDVRLNGPENHRVTVRADQVGGDLPFRGTDGVWEAVVGEGHNTLRVTTSDKVFVRLR